MYRMNKFINLKTTGKFMLQPLSFSVIAQGQDSNMPKIVNHNATMY
jgi:hypothetical protein